MLDDDNPVFTVIQPHFICNLLTSIASLHKLNDDDSLYATIYNLSRVFYYINSFQYETAIMAEVDFLKNIFELFKIRYPGSFSYDIKANGNILKWKIKRYSIFRIVNDTFPMIGSTAIPCEVRLVVEQSQLQRTDANLVVNGRVHTLERVL